MPSLNVIEIKDADLVWAFDGSDQPAYSIKDGTYTRSEKVDPFPAYAHDAALVRAELERTALLFPLPCDVYVYVAAFEGLGRTNAHASPGYDYQGEQVNGEYPISTGTIVLSGKRIPLHPAMTRYLVSHEYGHLVEYTLKRARLLDMDEYCDLRGMPREQPAYGGRNWHISRGEVFANDFRILVAGREAEFWPHPFPRPEAVPALCAWWRALGRPFACPAKTEEQPAAQEEQKEAA